jgi:hypothetical protein
VEPIKRHHFYVLLIRAPCSVHSVEVSTQISADAASIVSEAVYSGASSTIATLHNAASETKSRVSGAVKSFRQHLLSRTEQPTNEVLENPQPLQLQMTMMSYSRCSIPRSVWALYASRTPTGLCHALDNAALSLLLHTVHLDGLTMMMIAANASLSPPANITLAT